VVVIKVVEAVARLVSLQAYPHRASVMEPEHPLMEQWLSAECPGQVRSVSMDRDTLGLSAKPVPAEKPGSWEYLLVQDSPRYM